VGFTIFILSVFSHLVVFLLLHEVGVVEYWPEVNSQLMSPSCVQAGIL